MKKNTLYSPLLLLAAGFLLAVASGMRWNLPVAAWLYPVPFLLYVRLGYSQLLLLPVLMLSCFFQVFKIASPMMYGFIAIPAGIQAALFFYLVLWASNRLRQKSGDGPAAISFALMTASLEFIGSKFSPLGVWGMLANTQLDDLALLQSAALTGAYGISFLIAWAAALLADFIYKTMPRPATTGQQAEGPSFLHRQTFLFTVIFLAAQLYGSLRLDSYSGGKQIRAAAVSSKAAEISELLQSDQNKAEEARQLNNRDVMAKLRQAGELGAELIVTNEGAFALLPGEETALLSELGRLAQQLNANIAAGFITLLNDKKEFLNQAVWVNQDGSTAKVYNKQFIPPGEPARYLPQSIEKITTADYTAGLAICYDFDSPQISAAHGQNQAGLVAVPSSDWRGIDPIHTQMIKLRAIEQGYSIVRSTRAAFSAAYDNRGRSRAELPWYEENDGIMIAVVPVDQEPTIYAKFGDWFGWLLLAASTGVLPGTWQRKRA